MTQEGKKSALIVGSNGQDGQLLCALLSGLNYRIVQVNRSNSDIESAKQVDDLIKRVHPDEIYYLAAYHQSSEDKLSSEQKLLEKSFSINVISLSYFLEAVKRFSPKSKVFYAASSHIFSDWSGVLQDELTFPAPQNIYGITKFAGMSCCRYYRENDGLFVSCGILYNHESHLRSSEFFSTKVIRAALEISRGEKESVSLGSLDAVVDWGYAPDFVAGMQKVLQLCDSDDYVFATGIPHTAAEFVDVAFKSFGLDFRNHVVIEPGILNKPAVVRVGNSTKLRMHTGWKPSVSFEEMILKIINEEKRLEL